MDKINGIRLLIISPWTKISFKWGNKRSGKWLKKNAKNPQEEKFPLERRHEYIVKKMKTFTRRNNIKIVHENRDYLPKGSYILTPNLTNDFSISSLYTALGNERQPLFILDKESSKKYKGYATAANSFFVDWNDETKTTATLNAAASYSKTFNRPLVIFPERYPTNENVEYDTNAFKLAQKYFLPIVPTTITNLQKANKTNISKIEVRVKFNDVIKPMKLLNKPIDGIAKKVKNIVEGELTK